MTCNDGRKCEITEDCGYLYCSYSGWDCCSNRGGAANCPKSHPVLCSSPNECKKTTEDCSEFPMCPGKLSFNSTQIGYGDNKYIIVKKTIILNM